MAKAKRTAKKTKTAHHHTIHIKLFGPPTKGAHVVIERQTRRAKVAKKKAKRRRVRR
jgi:hypothetical protein